MEEKDCSEKQEISSAIGKIQGKLTVVLMLLLTLVGGVGYTMSQFHTIDKRLVIEEYKLTQKSGEHEKHLNELSDKIEALAGLCCGK